MGDEWWPPWWRRRVRPFELIDELMREFERWFEEEFRRFERELPRDLVREVKTPSGVRREIGPIVYGYSITIGPDGRPVIREFGNVRPGRRGGLPTLTVEREPLVDVLEEEDKVRVVAEVPGVQKEDIQLDLQDGRLVIKVDTPQRKYFKEVELPEEVDAENSKANYNNGVLEVILPKRTGRRPAKRIKIE